jgi:hypothetical protein
MLCYFNKIAFQIVQGPQALQLQRLYGGDYFTILESDSLTSFLQDNPILVPINPIIPIERPLLPIEVPLLDPTPGEQW